MKIVIAPDSFKGSLSSIKVADNIEIGIKRVFNCADVIKIPIADGGEGTVESLINCTNGNIIKIKVKDPFMRDIEAFYGILGDKITAVIEMAAASGICTVKANEMNPLKTTTYGVGELIIDAINKGCKKIIIGLGGSATNDGGAGMLQALGVRLLDKNRNSIQYGGGSLDSLQFIDLSKMDKRIKECEIVAACDVVNPLCGPSGASYVFGPQKGATPNMVNILDNNLEHYAEIIKSELNISIRDLPGSGAAGGLGGSVLAFLNAEFKKGIDVIAEESRLEDKIKCADLVFTGEGMIDYQTQFGKAPFGILKIAEKYHIPVIGIAGGLGEGYESLYKLGFLSLLSIVDKPMTLDESIIKAPVLIQNTTEAIMRIYKKANY